MSGLLELQQPMLDEKNAMDAWVDHVATNFNADIYLYVGVIFEPNDRIMIELLQKKKKHPNALLILKTLGGSLDVAYRIARAFQSAYHTKLENSDDRGQLLIYVPELCKSAGTLLTLSADMLIMSELGELGPIDVQQRKADEIGEKISGLTPYQALEMLKVESGLHFARFFRYLRFDQDLGFSTKLSADIAATLAVGLMGSIYAQFDPTKLGEAERFVRVSSEYGWRLKSDNVEDETIQKLVSLYPSHEFVIDLAEARTLFKEIWDPTPELTQIWNAFHSISIWSQPSFIRYLNTEIENAGENGTASPSESAKKPDTERGGRRKKPNNGQVRSSDLG